MLALAGIPLGCRFHFLDPSRDACAAPLGEMHAAEFTDTEAVRNLAECIDIATFDFENVPAVSARGMAERRTLRPGVDALEACQDRLAEKQLMERLGIAVPAHREVDSRTGLLQAVEQLGLPAVLKTRRLGYDGKGQAVLITAEDLEPAWQQLAGTPLVLEEFVRFDAECSVQAVRGIDGNVRFWPLIHNVHESGVLALSRPGVFGAELQREAENIARKLLGHWNYVGVLTVELFLREGALLVNEIAPRVHNSGHWSIDGAATSQFENHVRAICGWPLGATNLCMPSLMFNWIGALPDQERVMAFPQAHWHDYGKPARPGRKVGHATLTAGSTAELDEVASRLAEALGGNWPGLLAEMRACPIG
jgi:5-(carboxyamino)imidazole ribonucleotide synthase